MLDLRLAVAETEVKWCSKCRQHKPFVDFPNCKSRKDGKWVYCKECHNSAHRKHYTKNRQKDLARQRAYRAANPEVDRDWWLRSHYGIRLHEYNTLLEKQGGKCALCGNVNGKRWLAVDHCHQTGRVRGLLCNACNTAIGRLGDTPEAIRRVLVYLEGEAC